jgi:hypothetical protein
LSQHLNLMLKNKAEVKAQVCVIFEKSRKMFDLFVFKQAIEKQLINQATVGNFIFSLFLNSSFQ